jgi:hypothetical protein
VRDACAALGIGVDVVGAAAANVIAAPEDVLPQYDLVFAKARCAIEAMAAGCAVILCDAAGSGPMVTMADYEALRAWNFGARTLREALNVAALTSQIRRYDPAAAAEVSRAIRREADLEAAIDRYVAVYEEALAEPAPAPQREPSYDAIDPLLRRVAALELELSALTRAERMDPLREPDIASLRITLEHAPVSLAPGAAATVQVRLRNGLRDRALGSWRPHPLQWGVRWRAIDVPDFDRGEHPRTPIRYGIPPLGEELCFIRIAAPATPGRYVLRITLVQEWLQWLDEIATPICIDVAVEVTRASHAAP